MANLFESGVIDNPSLLTLTVSWDTETFEGRFDGFVSIAVNDTVAIATGFSEDDDGTTFASAQRFTWNTPMWSEEAIHDMYEQFISQGTDMRIIFAEEACKRLNKLIQNY